MWVMLADAIDTRTLQRVLVIKLRHHGDVLLAAPVFAALRAAIPAVTVDALVYEDSRELLSLNPDIGEIHTLSRDRRRSLGARLAAERRLLQTLKARHYELIIHLTEHPRGALLVRWLGPRYAVARRYPGRRGRWWRQSFSHLYDVPTKERHTVETHLDALRRLGIPIAPEGRVVRLVPGSVAEDRMQKQLAVWGLTDRPFVVVHPTSRWLFKCWPESHMAALLTRLAARGLRLVLTSGPASAEQERVRQILASAPASGVDVAGPLTLKDLAALIARARLFIGVDSAPMHMAAAVGTPVVAFFGPSGDHEWGPWQTPSRVLVEPFSCRPCGLAGCGEGQVSECLTAISVDRAEQAVLELMAATEETRCASS